MAEAIDGVNSSNPYSWLEAMGVVVLETPAAVTMASMASAMEGVNSDRSEKGEEDGSGKANVGGGVMALTARLWLKWRAGLGSKVRADWKPPRGAGFGSDVLRALRPKQAISLSGAHMKQGLQPGTSLHSRFSALPSKYSVIKPLKQTMRLANSLYSGHIICNGVVRMIGNLEQCKLTYVRIFFIQTPVDRHGLDAVFDQDKNIGVFPQPSSTTPSLSCRDQPVRASIENNIFDLAPVHSLKESCGSRHHQRLSRVPQVEVVRLGVAYIREFAMIHCTFHFLGEHLRADVISEIDNHALIDFEG